MIVSLRLVNFKSFRDATIEFGPFTVIVGSNGAGKSNLFDALRFLRSIGEGRSVRDALEGHALPGATSAMVAGVRGGGSSITHFLSEKPTFSLEVKLQVRSHTITYFVEVDASRYRVVSEELKSTGHAGPYVFSTRPEKGPLEQRDDSPGIAARFYKNQRGVNPKREFSPFEFIISQFVSRRAESRANELVADIVREELASLTPLELRPETLRQYSAIGRTQMGEHGENFAAAVWDLNLRADQPSYELRDGNLVTNYDEAARARRTAILNWLSEITPRPITNILTPTSPTGEVIFAVKEEPFAEPVNAPSLSDGTLRFAALALAAIGTGSRETLMIEEIENGINPTRLALLVRMLEQVSTVRDTQSQVLASTHSPAILEYASASTRDDAIVIGWDETGYSSRVVKVQNLPGLQKALRTQTLGGLQEEGWLQLAAGV